jgi:uncharacterized cupredoxin-like copper-binding protein
MRIPRALTALVSVVIATTALAACGSGNDSDQATKSDRTVTVKMTDNNYEPKNISAKAGESVTFTFVNDGQMTHEAYFGSEKDQDDHAAEMTGGDGGHSMHMGSDSLVTVEPGRDATVTKKFSETGTVVIGCHQPGHWESGMKARVTVR